MIMKLVRRTVPLCVTLAMLCGLQIGLNSSAIAAPVANPASGTTHPMAVHPADVTCPASGWVCFYQNANFLSDQEKATVDEDFRGKTIDNTTTAVRNRSNCPVRLYDTYTFSGSYITIAAHSEVANVGTTFGAFWNDRISSVLFVC